MARGRPARRRRANGRPPAHVRVAAPRHAGGAAGGRADRADGAFDARLRRSELPSVRALDAEARRSDRVHQRACRASRVRADAVPRSADTRGDSQRGRHGRASAVAPARAATQARPLRRARAGSIRGRASTCAPTRSRASQRRARDCRRRRRARGARDARGGDEGSRVLLRATRRTSAPRSRAPDAVLVERA